MNTFTKTLVISTVTTVFAAFITSFALPVQAQDTVSNTSFVPGEVIVRFTSDDARDDFLGSTTDESLRLFQSDSFGSNVEQANNPVVFDIKNSPPGFRIESDDDNITDLQKTLDVIQTLQNDPRIRYAEPNYLHTTMVTPDDDTRYTDLWGLNNTGQDGGTADIDIDAPEAWAVEDGSSNQTVVAVIDTGVNYTHPDLEDNIFVHDELQAVIPGNIIGWDFGNKDNDPMDIESGTHGTHVAGTIAAVDNTEGVIGVCPECKIMPIQVFVNVTKTTVGAPTTAIAEGVRFAVDNGADVINMSLGGPSFSEAMSEAVQYAIDNDVVVVAAAGNSGHQSNQISYPAGYDGVISVARINRYGEKANTSQYGSWIDISAPGSQIWSTIGAEGADGYNTKSGTSMASPHVAGVAGLMRAQNPGMSPVQVEGLIKRTSTSMDDQNPGFIGQLGAGMVNASNALTDNHDFSPHSYFTWNDTINGNQTWTLISNPSEVETIRVHLQIADKISEVYTLDPQEAITPKFENILDGPIIVSTENNAEIITTQRTHMWIDPQGRMSFNEYPGIPADSLETKYYFTWYDATNQTDAWVLVANPSNEEEAKVRITIGGVERGVYTIPAQGRITPIYKGLMDGAVVVESVANNKGNILQIIATQRVHMEVNGRISFNEYAGLNSEDIANEFYFTWNDRENGNSVWNLIGNPSVDKTARVSIEIGGEGKGVYDIAPNSRITPSFGGRMDGPVKITSIPNAENEVISVFATQRVYQGNTFNEFTGIPSASLTSDYSFTWSDGVNGNLVWVLVANPSDVDSTEIVIHIDNIERSRKTLEPGEIWTPSFQGIIGGPVRVESNNGNVIATQRVMMSGAFNEIAGLR